MFEFIKKKAERYVIAGLLKDVSKACTNFGIVVCENADRLAENFSDNEKAFKEIAEQHAEDVRKIKDGLESLQKIMNASARHKDIKDDVLKLKDDFDKFFGPILKKMEPFLK